MEKKLSKPNNEIIYQVSGLRFISECMKSKDLRYHLLAADAWRCLSKHNESMKILQGVPDKESFSSFKQLLIARNLKLDDSAFL